MLFELVLKCPNRIIGDAHQRQRENVKMCEKSKKVFRERCGSRNDCMCVCE